MRLITISELPAVLLVSEDLDELLTLCDRLLVLYEGQMVGSVIAGAGDREQVGRMMSGLATGA